MFAATASTHERSWTTRFDCPEFYGLLPLGAVLVLRLNDAVLKAAFHNTLTGKLSDVAGCFVLPLFVSALLALVKVPFRERLTVGVVFTVVFFSAIKLSAAAGALVCRWLEPLAHVVGAGSGLHIVTDPTDLLAFAVLPLTVHYARLRQGVSS